MPTAIIIAGEKKPTDGAAYAGNESAEDAAKFHVEVPLEGDEIEVTAPPDVDLTSVPQTGTALVHYSLDCQPDGGSCRVMLGKICFQGGDGEADEGKDKSEDMSKPGVFAAALAKKMAKKESAPAAGEADDDGNG